MNELQQRAFSQEIQVLLVGQAGHKSYRFSDVQVLLLCSRQCILQVSGEPNMNLGRARRID